MSSDYDALMSEINSLNPSLKGSLEKFGYIFIEITATTAKEVEKSDNNYLESLIIREKETQPSIIDRISGSRSIDEITSLIIDAYDTFNSDYKDLFDKIDGLNLDEQTIEAWGIIGKTISNRRKKIEPALRKFKLNIGDGWNIERLKEEFFGSFSKIIDDIIDSVLPSCTVGLQKNNSYMKIIELLNTFLKDLSIFTYAEVEENRSLTPFADDSMDPEESEESRTDDVTKKNMIRKILFYPYVLRVNGELQVVKHGKAYFWIIGA